LGQISWSFINDSFKTTLWLQHSKNSILAASWYLALQLLPSEQLQMDRSHRINLYKKIERCFGKSEASVRDIQVTLLDFYKTLKKFYGSENGS
jgi:hypothetical protein